MDSLRGIPVEHKLETFSMPSTGTTSCHPKIWLCWSERHSALDTQNYTVTLNPNSLTRPTTRCHLNIPLSHCVSKTNKPKHHESCSFQKQAIFHAANKVLSLLCVVKAKFRNSFVCLKTIMLSSKRYTVNLSCCCSCCCIVESIFSFVDMC